MANEAKRDKILDVKNLRVSFRTNGGTVKAVRGISFSLYKGRTLAIVGESGSGKSVTSKAILGILANNKIVEDGQIIYNGQDLLKIDEEHFHKIRGVKISMIFQDPLSSLNPIMIVGKQLTEAMALKQKADRKEAKRYLKRMDNLLYNHPSANIPVENAEEGSIIADDEIKEETTGDENLTTSDSEAKEETPKEIKKSFIFFDESGDFHYFKELIESDIARRNKAIDEILPTLRQIVDESFVGIDTNIEKTILKVRPFYKKIKECALTSLEEKDNIVEVFPAILKDIAISHRAFIKAGRKLERAFAKFGVSDFFALPPSERAKLPEVFHSHEEQVENLRSVLNELIAHLEKVRSEGDEETASYTQKALAEYKEAIEKFNNYQSKAQIRDCAIRMLGEVGIDEPERRFKQYPFELSGGMRQRIVIAIALCSSPEILICDEPTTALDVTIQAQILELINKLKKERDLSIVFITHDLGVVANMADDIAVMYAGKIVEYGTNTEIFYDPRHPYTWALLGSMPDLNTKEQLSAIPGTPPNMLLPPKGDAFAPRNAHALAIDQEMQPPFFEVSPTHFAATWNLHEEAPDLHAPEIVVERIEEAMTEHPEFMPKPENYKNSILNEFGKELANGREKE